MSLSHRQSWGPKTESKDSRELEGSNLEYNTECHLAPFKLIEVNILEKKGRFKTNLSIEADCK